MSWEEQYLKHTQPARVFSLERDAIEGRLLWFGEASRYSKADSGTAGHEDQANDEDREDGTFERIQLCGESPELATMRTQAYIQAWEACQSDIRRVLQEVYNDTIAQLHTFVESAPTRPCYGQRALSTGVILGANRTVSSALTEALAAGFEDPREAQPARTHITGRSRRTNIARITSRTCLNKRTALKTLVQAVIASGQKEGHETLEQPRRPAGKKLSMAADDDMDCIVTWYESRYQSQDTAPRIAIYFEELESFDSTVLTDLIEILSTYSKRLPIILLLAVSTSISTIHTLLPRSTSELLRIATFTVTPNIETFHSLVLETFIKRSQVLTSGPKVFNLLRTTFLDLNQSIDGYIAKLQYMYLAHFYGNPYSVLCKPLSEDIGIDDRLTLLGDIVPSLRSLPSFEKTVETQTKHALARKDKTHLRKLGQLLEDDEELLQYLDDARRERELYAKNLPQAWSLFDILQSSWTEGRLSTETLLTDYFAGNLLKRTNTACRNLMNARDDVVIGFLRRAQDALASIPYESLQLKDDLLALEELVETGTRQAGMTRLVNGNIQGSIAKSDGDRHFTSLVKALSDKLQSYFESHLKPVTELMFYEIWYPDVHRILRSTFHPHILDQIQSTLVDPMSRLPLHLIDDSQSLPTAEDLDVCRAFKLVSEAGKLVNLADWYGAFEVALHDVEEGVEGDSAGSREKRRKVAAKKPSRNGKLHQDDEHMLETNGDHAEDGEEDSDDEETARSRAHQARFLAAVADLAYLGFIQPTKRKVEHVARVVF